MGFQFLPVLANSLNVLASGASFLGSRRAGRDAAEAIIAQGEFDAEAYRRRLVGVLGAQRASWGAQGLDVSFGSPADIAAETTAIGEQDIAQIRENAMRQAMGAHRQANIQSYGAVASAFASLANLGANAWDAYSRSRAGRMKVNAFTGKANQVVGSVTYGPTYGPPTGY